MIIKEKKNWPELKLKAKWKFRNLNKLQYLQIRCFAPKVFLFLHIHLFRNDLPIKISKRITTQLSKNKKANDQVLKLFIHIDVLDTSNQEILDLITNCVSLLIL